MLAFAFANPSKDFVWETGDIIGHTSRSSQSVAVQVGTGSKYSHVGVVVYRNGKHRVLEAAGPVNYVSIETFLKRGEGRKYVALRPKTKWIGNSNPLFLFSDSIKSAS